VTPGFAPTRLLYKTVPLLRYEVTFRSFGAIFILTSLEKPPEETLIWERR